MDYAAYFIQQQNKHQASLQKETQRERQKHIKQSLKEYTLIKKNAYLDRKKYAFTEDEGYVCSCEEPLINPNVPQDKIGLEYSEDEIFGCGKSCINRMVSWECVQHLCPVESHVAIEDSNSINMRMFIRSEQVIEVMAYLQDNFYPKEHL